MQLGIRPERLRIVTVVGWGSGVALIIFVLTRHQHNQLLKTMLVVTLVMGSIAFVGNLVFLFRTRR